MSATKNLIEISLIFLRFRSERQNCVTLSVISGSQENRPPVSPIYSADEDFVLEVYFFDMEAGERTVKIIEGDPKNLCVRSVFDIR